MTRTECDTGVGLGPGDWADFKSGPVSTVSRVSLMDFPSDYKVRLG